MHRCCTSASTSGDQQVVRAVGQVAPNASHESLRGGRRRIASYHGYAESDRTNDMSQRARSSMDGGRVTSEVPTIFHPRRSLTSSVAPGEDQRTTHDAFASPIQVVLHPAGKHVDLSDRTELAG